MSLSSLAKGLVLPAVALALTACSLSDVPGFDKEKKKQEAADRGCPSLGVMADAGRLVRYRDGAARDITDIIFEARFDGLGLACEYDNSNKRLLTEMQFRVVATKGPAAQGNTVPFGYFVALLDENDQIIFKKNMTSEVRFALGHQNAATIETLGQKLPFYGRDRMGGLQMFVGFQLSKDELTFNREDKTGLR